MHDFDYLEPETIDEACAALAAGDEDTRVIAGGTALTLALRQRLVMPARVVSLARVKALRGIVRADNGEITIGACTCHAEIAQSSLVAEHQPMLARMAGILANPQVRNQGTLGGNLCYADPSTDPPGCLLAMEAQVVLRSTAGERRLPMSAFLVDYFETALLPGEILTSIVLPSPSAGARGTYARHLRTAAEHRPMANVSICSAGPLDRPTRVRLVVAAATPIPTLIEAARMLDDAVPTRAAIQSLARSAAMAIEPLSDARADGEYRRTVVKVLAERALGAHFGLEGDVS
jgi:carbon-monoxide dehydrogenase medium subunit